MLRCACCHRWERDRALRRPNPDTDKERDLAGQGSDDIPTPDEIHDAREELTTLAVDKERTERLKMSVLQELQSAKDKAAKIEQVI